jgi:two-component system sensor histidine kinase/response regulator
MGFSSGDGVRDGEAVLTARLSGINPYDRPPARILLVDDEQDNLLALEAVLESLGQEIVKANSGRQALRRLLVEDFAAIVLDVKMPEMDGFETAALIRQRDRSRHTPIIFLTGLKSEEMLFKGYCLGAVDYLFKPVVPEVLRAKVGAFIELGQKSALLERHAQLLESKNIALESLSQAVSAANGELRRLNGRLEQEIATVERQARELARSNEELERFAYIASHDLQEPLRTVQSYTQLLARRYENKLDASAQEFIGFITEGVSRMQSLIVDLLSFSRLNSQGRKPEPLAGDSVLEEALSGLQVFIGENGAEITSDPLPTVVADRSQLRQVFQNLVSNAIKFRRDEPPRIHVGARRDGPDWVFTVRDNGIGIEPRHFERIFVVFQRLHSRDRYPGTGIGLALCKRIVENHGGRIWVESQPGHGSTFCFTLPAAEAAEQPAFAAPVADTARKSA